MKKLLPFLFPSLATLIVIFLAYRWYSIDNAKNGQISPFAEGVEIENLSDEQEKTVKGTADLPKVELKAEGNQSQTGEIKYQIVNGKVQLSINAQLADPGKSKYQVWFKQVNGSAMQPGFLLEAGKGGFIGSAGLSESLLPFEVVISKEAAIDDALEEVMLKGIVPAQE